jgi:hypothetical protein
LVYTDDLATAIGWITEAARAQLLADQLQTTGTALHSSRRVPESSVRQELIGYVASISTAPPAAVGRSLVLADLISSP